MPSRTAASRLLLAAAAGASLATTGPEAPDVLVQGPEIVIHRDAVTTASIDIVFTGDEPVDAWITVDLWPDAGRAPGRPELTARLVDDTTGQELDIASGRGELALYTTLDCGSAPDCAADFTVEFEVTSGKEVELVWSVGLSYQEDPDIDVIYEEPTAVDFTVTVP